MIKLKIAAMLALQLLSSNPLLCQRSSAPRPSEPVSQRDALRGLSKMSVSVSDSGKLTYLSSGNKIVNLLQNRGIDILPDGAYPRLIISVDSSSISVGHETVWAMAGNLELFQLITTGGRTIPAITYFASNLAAANGLAKDQTMIELAAEIVEGFGKDFTAVNPNVASPMSQKRKNNPYDGEWEGTAMCAGDRRPQPLYWRAYTDPMNHLLFVIENEHTSKQEHFDGHPAINEGKLSGPSVEAQIQISADHNKITGTYSMHQYKCTTFSLHRVEE